MPSLGSLFGWKWGNKPQRGLESNPPASSNLPHSEAGPQNATGTREASLLVGANVDGGKPEKSSIQVDKSMETPKLAKDGTLGTNEPLGDSVDISKQAPLPNDDVAGEPGGQQDSTTRILPSDIDPDPRIGAPEVIDRSKALHSQWNQFNKSVTSFTDGLIRAGDLRREAIRRRENVVGEVEGMLASAGDGALRDFRGTLLGLKQIETELQAEDKKLIQQGFQIGRQGSKIFGPAAETSFQILNDQGVVVRSEESVTEDSVLSTDDIRLDQTPEAQRYLSKMGDVDVLQDILINMDAELRMLSETNETLDVMEELETRRKEVLNELRLAEEDLAKLYEDLPERRVNISEEQIRPPSETEQQLPSQSNIDYGETGGVLGSQSRSEIQGNSLSQILQSATNDNSVQSTTKVEVYLDYQSQQSPEERQNSPQAAEDARPGGGQAQEVDSQTAQLDS
ncbi:uncharacterized protein Z520_11042 [Fonsecaea multimorphosa CBS 102226]|uniref:Uncharacterized protein n=1 Tax=Fonsecaea multimorphosa CBS 102226 TaxID=1442371 RepID=A0A0D2K9W7_9EURO|nr:uncharacterized protein Z520_11042 [Fonsecaea multimorphosa CBS 102226]KIX93188.1 hypothetical protein Z520_11042 [Fonsecaea multimorphosa CBS 102226]OAL18426.1 hypothetical protein AYO22_10622 [Fonsecaea multimorphosa]